MSTAVLLLVLGMMCMFCAVAFIVVLNIIRREKNSGGGNPPPVPPPPGGGDPPTGGGDPPTGGGGDGSQFRNEEDLWRQVQANVEQLRKHVMSKYGSSENARALGKARLQVVKHRGQYSGLAYPDGRIEIKVNDGRYRIFGDVNNTIAHEIGHVIAMNRGDNSDHGPRWREIFLWLTNIAVNDLKWYITMGSLDCDSYKICSNNKSLCRNCVWTRFQQPPGAWQQDAPRMPSSLLA